MPNSIRTPRSGTTATSRRIAQAVDDERWQKYRVSMKGRTTTEKLDMLQLYWETEPHKSDPNDPSKMHDGIDMDCDVCIRLDNYLKALCRGGQLYPGESLETALATRPVFDLLVKRN